MSAGEEDASSITSSTPSSPRSACDGSTYPHTGFSCHVSSPSKTLGSPRSRTESKLKQVKDCKVCGDDTTGTYFGAVVCLPCKTFFIRYGGDGGRRLRCRSKNNCPVTVSTRTRCKYCRLMKCFDVGMARKERPEVIHAAQGQELCSVCSDIANGIHFGTYTCEGCKKFFRRGLKEHQSYRCALSGNCIINPRSRNTCRYCRYQKCLDMGMTSKVRVGRPRKLQRENVLHAAQSRTYQNRCKIPTDSLHSNGESLTDFQMAPKHPQASPRRQTGQEFPRDFGLPETSRMSEAINSQQATKRWLDISQQVIEIRPDESSSTFDVAKIDEGFGAEDESSQSAMNQMSSAYDNSLVGHVHIDGYTYVFSQSLKDRFYKTILPYWRIPRLPPSDVILSDAQKSLIQGVTSHHQLAINGLRGPAASAAVIIEAQTSIEMTPGVAEYMRHRLVRVLTSFISFIRSQPVLHNIEEADMSLLLRMNVSSWALIGAATHFFSALSDSLPRSLVDIQLHPENPHAALNERNLKLARKIHALNMDDSEAALLSIICVLSTDLARMKNPDAVEKTRWLFLEAFQAYASLKYGSPNGRIEELFVMVPEMRLTAIWFNDLSYLTWFPSTS